MAALPLISPSALQAAIAHDCPLVSPRTTVQVAIARMAESQASCVLVTTNGEANGQLCGILTERDLVGLCLQPTPLDQVPMEAVMSQPVVTLAADHATDIEVVIGLFRQHQIRHLPIVDQGDRWVGLLTCRAVTELFSSIIVPPQSDRQPPEPPSPTLPNLTLHFSVPPSQSNAFNPYKQIVLTTVDGLALVDRHYVYRLVNRVYVERSQIALQDIIGRSVAELHGETLFQTVIQPRLDRCFAGEFQEYEDWFEYANLGRRFINVTYSPYFELDGTISGAIVTTHDRTAFKQAEEALESSEQFLRSIYEGVEQVIFTVDVLADGSFQFADFNPAAERFSGQTAADYRGKTPSEQVSRHYRECLQAGAPITYEEQLHFRDRPTWWLTTLNPIHDASGQICRIVGTSTDITQRKQAEVLLAAQNTALESIARGEPLTAILDTLVLAIEPQLPTATCSILFCGPNRTLRHGSAPHLPLSYIQAINGIDIGEGIGSCGTAAFRGTPVIISDIATHPFWRGFRDIAIAHGLRACWSMPIVGSNGQVLGTFAVYHPTIHTPDPHEQRIITLAANIAGIAIEREQATQALIQLNQELEQRVSDRTAALQSSEERWHLALKGTNDGIWDWDLKTNTMFYSSRWKQMRGFADDEISDALEECLSRIHPDDLDRVTAEMENHFAGNTAFFESEYRTLCKDGRYIWVLDRGQALHDDSGQVIRMSGSETDISERKRLEAERQRAEQSLRRYERMVNASGDSMVLVDRHYRYQVINQAYQDDHGQSRDQILGHSVAEVMGLALFDHVLKEKFDQAFAGQIIRQELWMTLPNKPPQYMSVSWSPYLEADQTISGAVMTARNITDLKQAEAKLRESRRRYATLAAAAPVAILQFDRPLNCVYVNKIWAEMTGRTKDFALGQGWIESLHPQDRDRLLPEWEQKYAQASPEERIIIQSEGRHLRPDGSISWFYVQVAQELDSNGNAVGYIGTLTDITNRKQAEAALRKSEQRYRAIMDKASDAIVLADPQGNLIGGNHQAERLLGYSQEELRHLHVSQIHPPHALDGVRNHFQQIVDHSIAPTHESFVLHRDGQHIPVDITGSRIELEDEQIIQGIFRDVSDRKQLEAARQQVEAALKASEERYRQIVETQTDFVLLSAPDTTIVFANTALCTALGRSPDQLIGRAWSEFIAPDYVSRIHQNIAALTPSQPSFEMINPDYRATGQIGWTQWINLGIFDPEGNLIEIQSVGRDVTQIRRTEEALRKSETLFRSAFNGNAVGMCLASLEGRCLKANAALCNFLGYSEAELRQLTFQDLTYAGDLVRDREIADRIFAGEIDSFNIEKRYVTKQGNVVWGFLSSALVRDIHNQPLYFVSQIQNISARKHAELENLRLKERLQFVLSSNPAVIFTCKPNGAHGTTFISDNVYAMTGYAPADYLATSSFWADHLHPDDAPKIFADLPRLYQHGHHIHEYRFRHRDGHYLWIRNELRLVRDPQGQPLEIVGYFADINDRKQAELDLRESELRFRQMFESSVVGMIFADFDGRILDANDRFLQMVGYSRDDLNSGEIHWDAMTPAEYVPADFVAMAHLMQHGMIDPWEKEYYRKDGSRISVLIGAAVLPGSGDQTICVVVDISDRKQAEQALQASQRFVQQIADASPNLLYLYDIQTQRNIYVNHEIAQILGYSADTVQQMGDNFLQSIMHPDDLQTVYPAYLDTINQAQDGEIIETEYRLRHANGQWRWLYSRDSVFSRDQQGRVQQIVGTAQDMTDRKHLEQAQNRLIAILEASTDYISMADLSGNILWNNTALKDICGLQDGSKVRQRQVSHYHPQWALDLIEQQGIPTAIATGSWVGETAILDANNQEIPLSQLILAHKSPQGEVEFLSTIARDMRIRKEYEQQLEQTNAELLRATRLKDEFLANMSHELRTPLNAILGMSEGLQDEVFGHLNDRQTHAIATVERSGRHLLELINDILEVSKIAAGKLELETAPVLVSHLCNSSVVFVKQQALKNNIQLTTAVPQHLGQIDVDERRMRQVLINLLTNAVKFTPAGGQVRLEVRLETLPGTAGNTPDGTAAAAEPCTWIAFAVTDTGIGIAAADQPKLFQPFIQLDSSLSRQYEGTGLGLALVKQIAELHGGSVSLQSALGEGSCFTVRLPYTTDAIAPCAPQSPHQSSHQPPHQSSAHAENTSPQVSPTDLSPAVDQAIAVTPLILLVEDNEVNIITLSSYLNAKNYRIQLARNGYEAVNLAQSQPPDLILMDIQMPGMDGLEAIQTIRRMPHLTEIPIIALTALAMEGDRQRCLEAGATDYLAKPVKLKLLAQKLHTLLFPSL